MFYDCNYGIVFQRAQLSFIGKNNSDKNYAIKDDNW